MSTGWGFVFELSHSARDLTQAGYKSGGSDTNSATCTLLNSRLWRRTEERLPAQPTSGGMQGTRELSDGSALAGTDDRTGRDAEATSHVDDETRLWPRPRLLGRTVGSRRELLLQSNGRRCAHASLTDTRTRATDTGRAASSRSGGIRCGGPPGTALGKHSSSGAWPTFHASLSRWSSFSGQQKWLFSS